MQLDIEDKCDGKSEAHAAVFASYKAEMDAISVPNQNPLLKRQIPIPCWSGRLPHR